MKLYNLDLSPFTSRIRIQIYAKGVDVTLEEPPGGPSSEAYKALNPTGKVPALETDGRVIAESTAIFEYLEDVYADPSLRPSDPGERAQARTVSQYADLYVFPPLVALFSQIDPATRDAREIEAKLEALRPALDTLERLVTPSPYAVGATLSLADCTLFPLFFFATRLLPLLGRAGPLEGRPDLASWWQSVQQHDAVRKVDEEMQAALAGYMAGER